MVSQMSGIQRFRADDRQYKLLKVHPKENAFLVVPDFFILRFVYGPSDYARLNSVIDAQGLDNHPHQS